MCYYCSMSLIFITGNSGAGKSSVCKELQRLGYEAHDTDDDGMTVWRNKTTHETVERPADEAARTKEWYDHHEWRMSRQRVEELAARAGDKLVFLCGSPSNADEMQDLYDKVVLLNVDRATLKSRIAARTDHDFGKAPRELKAILGWHDSFQNRYKDSGAIIVDATQPLGQVVGDILDNLKPISD